MNEYIERNAAIAELIEDRDNDYGIYSSYVDKIIRDEKYDFAIELLYALPIADVAHVEHGAWVLGHVEPGYCTPGGNRPWICSECGEVISWRLDQPMYNYCHNCGAKMDGERNE